MNINKKRAFTLAEDGKAVYHLCLIKAAFTLAEVLMVMLVLSIIMAAFAPMMTTRNKVDLGNPWKFAANNSDIYYGIGTSQTAIIGQKEVKTSDPKSRLVISTDNNDQSHILFKKGTENVGNITFIPSVSNNYGNIGFGYNVLSKLIPSNTAYGNLSIGHSALETITTGQFNTAVGTDALQMAAGGSNNTAVGYYALKYIQGTDNTAIGAGASGSIESGHDNVAVGVDALYHGKTDSNYNVALGNLALQYVQGNYNVAVGYKACGYDGLNNSSNKICLGAYSGVTSPITLPQEIYIGSKSLYNNANAPLYIYNNSSGYINLNMPTNVRGPLNYYSTLNNLSDKRLKNIKGENKSGLGQIRELRVFDYTLKDDKSKTPRVGVIAQDLQKIFPDAVGKTDEGYLSVRQEDIFFAMVNAVKEMDTYVQGLINETKNILAKIKDINTRLTAQDEKIKSLEKQNAELEARIQKLEAKMK